MGNFVCLHMCSNAHHTHSLTLSVGLSVSEAQNTNGVHQKTNDPTARQNCVFIHEVGHLIAWSDLVVSTMFGLCKGWVQQDGFDPDQRLTDIRKDRRQEVRSHCDHWHS